MTEQQPELIPSDRSSEKKLWRSFSLNVSFIVLLFILVIFIGLFINNKNLIESEMVARARSHFNGIILTRRWSANHGGVFVKKTPGMLSNPYLENPDIVTTDGTVYTKKNPALMTREISMLAEEDDDFQFHITSLNPLNPDNAADESEKEALQSFERGAKEKFWRQKKGKNTFFKYMAPLYVEEPCLQCHAKQGYKAGDVRGGISVMFNINDIEKNLKKNQTVTLSLFIVTSLTLIGIIYFFIIGLSRKLTSALNKIHEMAVTDDLTKIHNRRFFLKKLDQELQRSQRYKHPINCIMLDVDFFKNVNDTYGHHAGDMVLRSIAAILQEACRASDTVARYGGEEFILFLSETNCNGVLNFSEKIRTLIESTKITITDSIQLQVTVSLGVVCFPAETAMQAGSVDQIINLADKAMYAAKDNGRNRTEHIVRTETKYEQSF